MSEPPADGHRDERSLAGILEEARERLAELAPYLDEAERLRTVLDLLSRPCPGPSTPAPIAAGITHVPARKAEILAIVAAHPGITVAEIAAHHRMKRAVVASSVSRLKRSGELVYREGGVRLANAVPALLEL